MASKSEAVEFRTNIDGWRGIPERLSSPRACCFQWRSLSRARRRRWKQAARHRLRMWVQLRPRSPIGRSWKRVATFGQAPCRWLYGDSQPRHLDLCAHAWRGSRSVTSRRCRLDWLRHSLGDACAPAADKGVRNPGSRGVAYYAMTLPGRPEMGSALVLSRGGLPRLQPPRVRRAYASRTTTVFIRTSTDQCPLSSAMRYDR